MDQPQLSSSFAKLFFDKRDYSLLAIVNGMISGDASQRSRQRQFFHYFHPRGIKEMAEPRVLRIDFNKKRRGSAAPPPEYV